MSAFGADANSVLMCKKDSFFLNPQLSKTILIHASHLFLCVPMGSLIFSLCIQPHDTNTSLLEHCRKHKYLARTGENFVTLVVRLLERLLDYRTIMHDENKENRMSCTVNVLVRSLLSILNAGDTCTIRFEPPA